MADSAPPACNELLPLMPLLFLTAPIVSKDIGPRGELVWLPLSALRIDPRYQRPILNNGRATIKSIVENFQWAMFSPVIVGARPGGLYAIIDGQHRVTGALTHGGVTHVPCYVLKGGAEVEARAFAIINGHVTSITSTQIHVAKVMGGVGSAVRIDRACQAAMVRVVRTPAMPGYWKVGDTVAVGTLETCLKRYGSDVLTAALQCITQTGDGNPGWVRATMIRGLCDALASNATWADAGERLFKAIETAGIPNIFDAAKRFRAINGGTEWLAVSKLVRELLSREMAKPAAVPALPAPPAPVRKR